MKQQPKPAPKTMKPWEGWCLLDNNGHRIVDKAWRTKPVRLSCIPPNERWQRVLVTGVPARKRGKI